MNTKNLSKSNVIELHESNQIRSISCCRANLELVLPTDTRRIRSEMGEHKSATRVMNTFENRYNAQMKMLKEQNRLLKGLFHPFICLHSN